VSDLRRPPACHHRQRHACIDAHSPFHHHGAGGPAATWPWVAGPVSCLQGPDAALACRASVVGGPQVQLIARTAPFDVWESDRGGVFSASLNHAFCFISKSGRPPNRGLNPRPSAGPKTRRDNCGVDFGLPSRAPSSWYSVATPTPRRANARQRLHDHPKRGTDPARDMRPNCAFLTWESWRTSTPARTSLNRTPALFHAGFITPSSSVDACSTQTGQPGAGAPARASNIKTGGGGPSWSVDPRITLIRYPPRPPPDFNRRGGAVAGPCWDGRGARRLRGLGGTGARARF